MLTNEQRDIILFYCERYGKLIYSRKDKTLHRRLNIEDSDITTKLGYYNDVPVLLTHIDYPLRLCVNCNNQFKYKYHNDVLKIGYCKSAVNKNPFTKPKSMPEYRRDINYIDDTAIRKIISYLKENYSRYDDR